MKPLEFKIKYCELCQGTYVECPICGNNCCNGGYGKVDKNGKPLPWNSTEEFEECPYCSLAYEFQNYHWLLESIKEFLNEIEWSGKVLDLPACPVCKEHAHNDHGHGLECKLEKIRNNINEYFKLTDYSKNTDNVSGEEKNC